MHPLVRQFVEELEADAQKKEQMVRVYEHDAKDCGILKDFGPYIEMVRAQTRAVGELIAELRNDPRLQ